MVGHYAAVRMATVALGVSLAVIGGCSADKVTTSSNSLPTSSVETTSSMETSTSTTVVVDPSAPASILLELNDYLVFVEGFDYGVRLEIDGAVTDERLLPEFDGGYREPIESSEWRTRFVVPAGEVMIVSDLNEGGPGAAAPPDFTDPCRTVVTVAPGSETTFVLDWLTGCVGQA